MQGVQFSLAPRTFITTFPALTRSALIALLLTAAPAFAQQPDTLRTDWRIQSSAKVGTDGARISSASYRTDGWHRATVPNTVVGALVEDSTFRDPFRGKNLRSLPGMSYDIGKLFVHIPMDSTSPFAVPWWYRRTFVLPASYRGQRVALHFNGINYRANVWLNGRRIADSTQIAGAFRRYELDVTPFVNARGANVLAVEVYASTPADLATSSIDWYPSPPDKMMGLWHEVYLSASGPVVVRYPQVASAVDTATLQRADLTVRALVQNRTDRPVTGVLRGRIGRITFEKPVTLAAHDSADVAFAPESFPQLHVNKPRLWWPAELGRPELQTLELAFYDGARLSDRQRVRFGIRTVTSEFTPQGGLLFRINGKRILIRGAGWTPDIFFRPQPERQLAQMRYTLDMHLNTIRLEGKLEDDLFWQRADSMGILIMPGWACCSSFEEWSKWGPEQYAVAAASLKDQIHRLRNHPSAYVWLNGSDNAPPADVEKIYLQVEKDLHWPNPTVSSAAAAPAKFSGRSGVKMNGPYYWVPPSYWLTDTTHGGAFGYATEIGPGTAIPPIETVRRFIPADHMWPFDSVWSYHLNGGHSNEGIAFRRGLAERYGEPTSAEDFTSKSQLMTYEAERAMFEGYRRNKYFATGVIQWMLNNAWPQLNWHLFDWYLRPAGGYFGTRKANEPVHVMYSYDDRTAVITNALRHPLQPLHLRVRVFDVAMRQSFARDTVVTVPADTSLRVLTIPPAPESAGTYFVDLRLTDAAGKEVSTNLYWLSTHPDVMDLEKSTGFVTPVTRYADFSALKRLPQQRVKATTTFTRTGDRGEAHVRLANPGTGLAFFIRLQVKAGADGDEVLPVEWSDNYVSLLPGETRTLTARYSVRDLHGRRPALGVSGWNVAEHSTTRSP